VRRVSRWLAIALVASVSSVNGGQQSSQPPNPRQSETGTLSQSDRDACSINKDHESCKRYYRSLCLGGDAFSCRAYASELSKDCPKPTDTASPEDTSAATRCAAKIKCWQDRALSLAMLNGACAEDRESPNCVAARSPVTTPASCDSQ